MLPVFILVIIPVCYFRDCLLIDAILRDFVSPSVAMSAHSLSKYVELLLTLTTISPYEILVRETELLNIPESTSSFYHRTLTGAGETVASANLPRSDPSRALPGHWTSQYLETRHSDDDGGARHYSEEEVEDGQSHDGLHDSHHGVEGSSSIIDDRSLSCDDQGSSVMQGTAGSGDCYWSLRGGKDYHGGKDYYPQHDTAASNPNIYHPFGLGSGKTANQYYDIPTQQPQQPFLQLQESPRQAELLLLSSPIRLADQLRMPELNLNAYGNLNSSGLSSSSSSDTDFSSPSLIDRGQLNAEYSDAESSLPLSVIGSPLSLVPTALRRPAPMPESFEGEASDGSWVGTDWHPRGHEVRKEFH